ncbi:MAG TPA: VPLPA-CTERM sorting domain-containing protein [Gammaproteobacteria bacterium]|nr:VPLPA-CTERM sorting domain-containing protein [Gammaproteobacteria bacterium]
MKKLLLTASVAGLMVTAANATPYPTFTFDESASSISVTPNGSLCFGCDLTASFSAGVDGASWTPTSATDSWTIGNFIDWNAAGGFGGALYDVAVTLAFSSPDPASTSTTGAAGYASFFGVISGGFLSWDPVPSLTFAQGSTLDIALEDGIAIGFGTSVSTGATFTGNTIAPVPLPATGLLLLAGIAGLGVARKRKKAA